MNFLNYSAVEIMALANLPSLGEIKAQAKTMNKKSRIKYKNALDLSAQSYGFTNYKSAQGVLSDIKIKRPPEGGLNQGESQNLTGENVRIKV